MTIKVLITDILPTDADALSSYLEETCGIRRSNYEDPTAHVVNSLALYVSNRTKYNQPVNFDSVSFWRRNAHVISGWSNGVTFVTKLKKRNG